MALGGRGSTEGHVALVSLVVASVAANPFWNQAARFLKTRLIIHTLLFSSHWDLSQRWHLKGGFAHFKVDLFRSIGSQNVLKKKISIKILAWMPKAHKLIANFFTLETLRLILYFKKHNGTNKIPHSKYKSTCIVMRGCKTSQVCLQFWTLYFLVRALGSAITSSMLAKFLKKSLAKI